MCSTAAPSGSDCANTPSTAIRSTDGPPNGRTLRTTLTRVSPDELLFESDPPDLHAARRDGPSVNAAAAAAPPPMNRRREVWEIASRGRDSGSVSLLMATLPFMDRVLGSGGAAHPGVRWMSSPFVRSAGHERPCTDSGPVGTDAAGVTT